jgi:hypothetical protein
MKIQCVQCGKKLKGQGLALTNGSVHIDSNMCVCTEKCMNKFARDRDIRVMLGVPFHYRYSDDVKEI